MDRRFHQVNVESTTSSTLSNRKSRLSLRALWHNTQPVQLLATWEYLRAGSVSWWISEDQVTSNESGQTTYLGCHQRCRHTCWGAQRKNCWITAWSAQTVSSTVTRSRKGMSSREIMKKSFRVEFLQVLLIGLPHFSNATPRISWNPASAKTWKTSRPPTSKFKST